MTRKSVSAMPLASGVMAEDRSHADQAAGLFGSRDRPFDLAGVVGRKPSHQVVQGSI